MSKLPQVRPTSLVKFFVSLGFVIARQVGSHMRLIHPDGRKITIAIHTKPIAKGTLNAILKQAQMGRDTFLKLYHK